MFNFRKKGLAWLIAKGTARYERMVAERKQTLFAGELGDVIEIGAGAGANLRYLSNVKSYLAIEPNPYMHPHLKAELERCHIHGEIVSATAEQALAGLPEAAADTVICTLVLCSVRDSAALLRLVRRVLRPGGRLLFVEHVGAQRGSRLLLCQSALVPLFHYCGDGCHPNRNTRAAIEAAGFRKTEIEAFQLPLGPISPHLSGWASK